MAVPRIKSVLPLENNQLLVTFINGVQKTYDCRAIMRLAPFQALKNKALFKTVTVDVGGYGLSWDDDTDLSEYELWNNGVELEQSEAQSQARPPSRAHGAVPKVIELTMRKLLFTVNIQRNRQEDCGAGGLVIYANVHCL